MKSMHCFHITRLKLINNLHFCTDYITCKNGISVELITKLLGKLVLYSAGVQHMRISTKIPLLKEVGKSSKTGQWGLSGECVLTIEVIEHINWWENGAKIFYRKITCHECD